MGELAQKYVSVRWSKREGIGVSLCSAFSGTGSFFVLLSPWTLVNGI